MEEVTKKILAGIEDKMDKSVTHLADHLRSIRTGRASPALLDGIRVNYYGTMTPLIQLAHVSVPEARQLLVKPFDTSAIKDIERAIQTSDLGLMPMSDGKQLRLSLPPLSEEQRKKLAAKVKDICEQTRVALRNERRDGNKAGDTALREGRISEDFNAELHDRTQDALKKAEARVDDLLKKKTAEIMEG